MVTWGKTKSESRVTAEFYKAAIGVMRGAEAIDRYTALPRQEAFDIEYWQLEEAKLQRMPPEKELSRRIFAVVGAGRRTAGLYVGVDAPVPREFRGQAVRIEDDVLVTRGGAEVLSAEVPKQISLTSRPVLPMACLFMSFYPG